MCEHRLPTERELDALLEQAPQYDLAAVKARTFGAVGAHPAPKRSRGRRLKSFLLVAVLCAFCVTAFAAADYAAGGKLTRALGIRPPAPEQTEEAPPVQTQTPEEVLPPAEEPEEDVPLPELDSQLAEVLDVPPAQAQQLRPALQGLELVQNDQDIRMTVLQTLGDPYCLYVKLRFDFPTAVSTRGPAEFDEMELTLDAGNYSWHSRVLERTERTLTCLLEIQSYKALNGQTLTLRFANHGRSAPVWAEDGMVQVQLSGGREWFVLVDPDGSVNANLTAAEAAALGGSTSSPQADEAGFTVTPLPGGSRLVTYDGLHGTQYVTVLSGASPEIVPGDAPLFQAAVTGSWSQSWVLSYQDLSLYWTGSAALDPALELTAFRLSPLSWDALVSNSGASLPLEQIWDARVLHADGSVTDLPLERPLTLPGADDGSATIHMGALFEQPLDLSDAVTLILGGREFHLSPAGGQDGA